MFETFKHTADLGLRIQAETREALFEEAARGLFSVILEYPERVSGDLSFSFRIEGTRDDELLLDWLDALLFKFSSEHVVLGRFEVRFGEDGLTADAWGEPYSSDVHGISEEVKAITYHGLRVEKFGEMWIGEVIIDL